MGVATTIIIATAVTTSVSTQFVAPIMRNMLSEKRVTQRNKFTPSRGLKNVTKKAVL